MENVSGQSKNRGRPQINEMWPEHTDLRILWQCRNCERILSERQIALRVFGFWTSKRMFSSAGADLPEADGQQSAGVGFLFATWPFGDEMTQPRQRIGPKTPATQHWALDDGAGPGDGCGIAKEPTFPAGFKTP